MSATTVIRQSDLLPQPDGQYTVRVPNGGVLSVQPDGSLQSRPAGTTGPWEKGSVVGNKFVLTDSGYPTGAYALLVVP